MLEKSCFPHYEFEWQSNVNMPMIFCSVLFIIVHLTDVHFVFPCHSIHVHYHIKNHNTVKYLPEMWKIFYVSYNVIWFHMYVVSTQRRIVCKRAFPLVTDYYIRTSWQILAVAFLDLEQWTSCSIGGSKIYLPIQLAKKNLYN